MRVDRSSDGSLARLFVGRERELAELTAGLGDARSGHGRLFLLTGEPGIGKTRLADEFSRQATEAGALVLWGRCWEGGGAPAYLPWLQILRAYLRRLDPGVLASQMGSAAPHLAAILPELRERLPHISSPKLEGDDARFAVFDAVSEFLLALGRDAPLVITIDDLHAADPESLRLLQYFSRGLRGARVLAIGSYRDVEARLKPPVEVALQDLAREATRLPLRGLSESEVGRFLERLAGAAPSEELLEAVHRHTEGNPLFVDEVVRLLAAEGRLEDPSSARALRIPDAVRATISRRLAHLSDEALHVLSVASVIGRDFDVPLLAPVSAVEPDSVARLLGEAARAGIVGEAAPFGRASFAHALFRETLYAAIPAPGRAALHGRVAEALERVRDRDLEAHLDELAYHSRAALPATGDARRAVDYSARAGARAMALLAYEEAAEHYRHAIEASSGDLDDVRKCELLLSLGEAQWRAGYLPKARETFLGAADLARRMGSAHRLACAALGYGSGHTVYALHDLDERIVTLLEEANQTLRNEEGLLRVRVLARLAVEGLWSEGVETRNETSRMALEIAERLGDPEALFVALYARCHAIWGPDGVEERLALVGRMLRLATEVGDKEMSYLAHEMRFRMYFRLGDMQAADADLSTCARLAEDLRIRLYREHVSVIRMLLLMYSGQLDEAEGRLREALRRPGASNEHLNQIAIDLKLLSHLRGSLAEAADGFRAFAERFPWVWVSRAILAATHAEMGCEDDARREVEIVAGGDPHLLPRNDLWLFGIHCLSMACARLRDQARATILYDMLLPYAERVSVCAMAASVGSASLPLALLAATLSRWDEALHHFGVAFERNLVSHKPWAAVTLRDHAATLLARGAAGDAERALELAEKALAMMREMSMQGWIPSAESMAERARRLTLNSDASLRKDAEGWALEFGGHRCRLGNVKGMDYLARLLRSPYEAWHVLDLAAGAGEAAEDRERTFTRAELVAAGLRATRLAEIGPLLDPMAKAAYRARLAGLEEDREDARRSGDATSLARVDAEIDAITDQLASAVGRGGRDRTASPEAERARINVSRSLKTAIRQIAKRCPAAGRHLTASIRTGWFCSYAPDPSERISWAV